MDQAVLQSIRESLEREQRSIERQLQEYGGAPGGAAVGLAVDEGFADSAQATAERAEMMALVEQLHRLRAEVGAALVRLDQGIFGTCQGCGEAIAPERLEALPTATLCLTCKQVVH